MKVLLCLPTACRLLKITNIYKIHLFCYYKIKTRCIFRKKKFLALIIALILSFNTVAVFAEETKFETIIGTENGTINNLLEMARLSYDIKTFSGAIETLCSTTQVLIISSITVGEKQKEHNITYTQIINLEKSISDYQNTIDEMIKKYPALSGDLQRAKKNIDILLSACDVLKKIVLSLSEYNANSKNYGEDFIKQCVQNIDKFHETMVDFNLNCEDVFLMYFEEALYISEQNIK